MPPLAFPLGGVLGEFRVLDVRVKEIENGEVAVAWTAQAQPSPAAFIIAVDGRHYRTVHGMTSYILKVDPGTTHTVEVLQVPSAHADVGYFPSGLFTSTQDNIIRVGWAPPASVTDVESYRVYWDKGEGTVQFTDDYLLADGIQEDGSSSYAVETPEIAADTYKFVVRTVDKAGNESSNTGTTSETLSKYISPVTVLSATYSAITNKVTLTWVDPAGVTNLRVYHNAGDDTKPYPDYGSLIATVGSGVQTWESPVLTEGLWVFGVRAYDGTAEEPNTQITVRVRLDASLNEISGYPAKPILLATESAGGKIRLRGFVDPSAGDGTPDQIKFYTNDGAGGAVDYSSAIATVDLIKISDNWFCEFETIQYGETARKFGARSVTSDGDESENATEQTITPDSTVPPQPLSVTATATR